MGRQYTRTLRTSSRQLACGRCSTPIAPQEPHGVVRGTPVHPQCDRLQVWAMPPAPRYQHDPAAGQPCTGCGHAIGGDERVVYVLARPWHHDCRVREVRA